MLFDIIFDYSYTIFNGSMAIPFVYDVKFTILKFCYAILIIKISHILKNEIVLCLL